MLRSAMCAFLRPRKCASTPSRTRHPTNVSRATLGLECGCWWTAYGASRRNRFVMMATFARCRAPLLPTPAPRPQAAGSRVTLAPREAEIGFYQTDVEIDPFRVDPAERERLVLEALRAAGEERGVVRVQAGVNAKRQHRFFANSEGSLQEQHFVESGGMVLALAANDHLAQRRSYPNSFHGNTAAAGWEYVQRLDLVNQAQRVGAEAVQLLSAPVVGSGFSSLVIGPAQMALQIHESTGHALELDRILGDEANFAVAPLSPGTRSGSYVTARQR